MSKTCLVTGCAGFVGSHLVETLLQHGHEVIGVDNFFSGHVANMTGFSDNPHFTFRRADIRQPGLVGQLKRTHPGLSHLFHLAAIVSVPYSVAHPEETMAVNLEASLLLHAESRTAGVEHFVFAGSAAEYGDCQDIPLREEQADALARWPNPYGEAKYLFSRHIEATGFGLSLRFFNIYGPRQDPSSPYSGVISRFMQSASSGKALSIFGDGCQTRDFIHIDDVVRAYMTAAGLTVSYQALQGIYNVGTGVGHSIGALANMVATVTGRPCPKEVFPQRAGDIRHSVADISKLRCACGFQPRIHLEQGLGFLSRDQAARP